MQAVVPLTRAPERAKVEIPQSHRDLIDCPPVTALSTIGPDGYPQTSVVWCDDHD